MMHRMRSWWEFFFRSRTSRRLDALEGRAIYLDRKVTRMNNELQQIIADFKQEAHDIAARIDGLAATVDQNPTADQMVELRAISAQLRALGGTLVAPPAPTPAPAPAVAPTPVVEPSPRPLSTILSGSGETPNT